MEMTTPEIKRWHEKLATTPARKRSSNLSTQTAYREKPATRITSRHYAHLCDNTLKAAVAKLPSFEHQAETKVQAIR